MDMFAPQAISAGGMTSAISRAADASVGLLNVTAPPSASSAAPATPAATSRPKRAGEVVADIVANAVELMGAVYALRMNKVAFKTAQSETGTALSLKA
jgi:hypothetical protein